MMRRLLGAFTCFFALVTGAAYGEPKALQAQQDSRTALTGVTPNRTILPINVKEASPPLAPAGGSTTALVDLGHVDSIRSLEQFGDRVLSRGGNHWILWDRILRTPVSSGDLPSNGKVQLAGSTFLVQLPPTTVEIRTAVDGQLLFSVSIAGNAGLSNDGLYLWVTGAGIGAWNLSGERVLNVSGDYSRAQVYESGDELRVALSPTHGNAIEVFDLLSGGMSVTPSFSGNFHSWFLDGEAFFTTISNTVWIYSKSAIQLEIVSVTSTQHLTGHGDYFWTFQDFFPGYPLRIYRVGGSPDPLITYSLDTSTRAIGIGNKIALLPYGAPQVDIISLEKEVTRQSYAVPLAYLSAFVTDGTNWTVGNYQGAIIESSSSQPLGYGRVWSIAGGENGTCAVATASGKILVFSLQPSKTTFTGSIDFSSSHVEMSSDGTVLAAQATTEGAQYWTDRSLKIFAIPDLSEIMVWPHDVRDPIRFLDFHFSRSGDRLAHLLGTYGTYWTYSRMLTDVFGTVTYFSDSNFEQEVYKLAPNGRRFSLNNSATPVSTQLFDDGALVGAVEGSAAGWLDNDRILVNVREGSPLRYVVKIYNSRGNLLFTPALPEGSVETFDVISPTRIYARSRALFRDTILDLESGESVWSQGDRTSAVAGEFTVYTQGAQVFARRFTRDDDVRFQAARNFPVGSTSFSTAVADFNGDGWLDLVVANFSTDSVSVLLGYGDGRFQAPRAFATGGNPFSVVVGDFDGDGRMDLAVANSDSTDVSVLLGNGDGSFQPAQTFQAGTAPVSIAVADFNGDGWQDLAVANISSDNVSVLLGNGDGTFRGPRDFATGSQPSSVAVGDFNGDGLWDLALANSASSNASVLLGNGDGTFQAARNFGAGNAPVAVAVSDFNGDGRQDIVVANQNSNNVSVLLGNGDGSFQAARDFPAGHFPWSVTVSDFNGDGQTDLAVASEHSNGLLILLGNGDGSFQAPKSFAAGSGPASAAVGDFNDDGLADLAVSNLYSNDVSVLIKSSPP